MPRHFSYFQAPAVHTIPLQLLAHHCTIHQGADVDQPRNLEKSVKVEWQPIGEC
jgi:glucosamine--fructose-6-phosphate aminotransferase (isomerizing)